MGTVHRFPGAATPADIAGLSAHLAQAAALLNAIRDRLPRNPEHSDGEHELEVLGRAIRALQAARPLFLAGDATPDAARHAHTAALIDEALVLADLCGQAVHQLEPKRQAHALPVVLNALTDAITCGPEAAHPPFPQDPTGTASA